MADELQFFKSAYTKDEIEAAIKAVQDKEFAAAASPVFTGSISMGRKDGAAIGQNSAVVGNNLEASGSNSFSCGSSSIASGYAASAQGLSAKASGDYSYAEGKYTEATGPSAHAEGSCCKAAGDTSHAEGYYTTTKASFGHSEGVYTISAGFAEHAGGKYNKESTNQSTGWGDQSGDIFVLGNGTSEGVRSNCFRVTLGGAVYALSGFNSSGADYAELFEWLDGNPDGEDRAGRFVALDGEKIRLAAKGDDYILGVVSAHPSAVGDVYDDQWQGMYLCDVFGRPIFEDVEVPRHVEDLPGGAGKTIVEAHTERRLKLNPDYDNAKTYIPRTKRAEWAAVGLVGKLVMVDDGTCQINGWCKVGENGAAAASKKRTRFRVMARLDDSHIRVMVL